MRSGVKAAVVLLVTLPMLAYVAGRLAAAPPEDAPRPPVILEGPADPTRTPSPDDGPDDGRDDGPDDGPDDGRDDGPDREVDVVNPSPTRVVGEDDDDDLRDDEAEGQGDDEAGDRTDDDTSGGD